jgi:type IV fimbrial biogenesis protein FimT
MNTMNKRASGFTLVELMITIGIASILLGLVAPGMAALLERNRVQTATTNFYSGLMLARSEALKRNQPVVMCKSADAAACATTGNWDQGWLVYADADSSGSPDPSEILRVGDALRNGDTVRVAAADAAIANAISYRTDGSTSGTGTLVICNSDEELSFAREINVSVTGRPKVNKSTADCTP